MSPLMTDKGNAVCPGKVHSTGSGVLCLGTSQSVVYYNILGSHMRSCASTVRRHPLSTSRGTKLGYSNRVHFKGLALIPCPQITHNGCMEIRITTGK